MPGPETEGATKEFLRYGKHPLDLSGVSMFCRRHAFHDEEVRVLRLAWTWGNGLIHRRKESKVFPAPSSSCPRGNHI